MILQPFLDVLIFIGAMLFSYISVQVAVHFIRELDNLSLKDKLDLGFWAYVIKALMYSIILGSFVFMSLAAYTLFF